MDERQRWLILRQMMGYNTVPSFLCSSKPVELPVVSFTVRKNGANDVPCSVDGRAVGTTIGTTTMVMKAEYGNTHNHDHTLSLVDTMTSPNDGTKTGSTKQDLYRTSLSRPENNFRSSVLFEEVTGATVPSRTRSIIPLRSLKKQQTKGIFEEWEAQLPHP